LGFAAISATMSCFTEFHPVRAASRGLAVASSYITDLCRYQCRTKLFSFSSENFKIMPIPSEYDNVENKNKLE